MSLRDALGAAGGWERVLGGLCALSLLSVSMCPAQYRVFSWENNEGGAISSDLLFKFDASPGTVEVVDMQLPALAPALLSNQTAVDIAGRYAMRLTATPRQRFQCVVHNAVLQRSLLGQNGKALVQADFFLPAAGNHMPNMAVLATSQESHSGLWRTYRVGIMMTAREPIIYFSYADESIRAGTPIMTRNQSLRELGVTPNSWHRLQIIFDGQQKIVCAIDGKPTRFSPVIEPSLTTLQMGIMVTTPENEHRVCYADNLSIQWSVENAPLPESPWTSGDTELARLLAVPGSPGAGGGAPTAQQSRAAPRALWLSSPDLAWQQAQSQQRPVLALFFTRTARSYPSLERTLTTDTSAQQLVSNFVPLYIDANQLMGGTLAQKFDIFRVPTFLIVDHNGNEKGRVVYDVNTGWSDTASRLQGALAAR